MKLVSRDVAQSPDSPDKCRVTVRILLESEARELCVWFDIPEESRSDLSESGNPWLVFMLPMALTAGEDIELPLPVEPLLLENVRGLMRFWNDHFPDMPPVQIRAPMLGKEAPSVGRHGLFFSGGVDSTFSLLRHGSALTGCGSKTVDDLIFVGGLDIRVTDREEIALVQAHLTAVAAAHGKKLLTVETNLRELDCAYNNNWLLFYGCALGTVGHLLSHRFNEIIFSSEQSYAKLNVTGSHPISDALLSSRILKFVHDGASFTRVEKTIAVAIAETPLHLLRVCWESKKHDNCSRCSKCLRTMVTLDLAGYKEKADCFDWSAYKVDNIGTVFLYNRGQTIFFEEILEEARRRGRNDIVEIVSSIIKRSARIRGVLNFIRNSPLIWRYEYHARQYLMYRYFGNRADS